MRNTLLLVLLAAALAAPAAPAAETKFPQGYWERGYPQQTVPAITINMTIEAADLEKSAARIEKILTHEGASRQDGRDERFYYNSGQNGAQSRKTLAFRIKASRARSAAKALFDVGDLLQFSTNRQDVSRQLDEIKSKLKAVDEESRSHSKPLEEMPISSYFLTQLHDRLSKAEDAYESGRDSATIFVTILEKTKDR
jgi:hypothetical protein